VYGTRHGRAFTSPGSPFQLAALARFEQSARRVESAAVELADKYDKASRDAPPHASELKVDELTQDQIDSITSFLTSQQIARIAVTVTSITKLHPDLPTVDLVSKALLNRIADVAKWTRFGQLAVVIESSERADPLLQAALQDLRLEEDAELFLLRLTSCPSRHTSPRLKSRTFLLTPRARRRSGGWSTGRALLCWWSLLEGGRGRGRLRGRGYRGLSRVVACDNKQGESGGPAHQPFLYPGRPHMRSIEAYGGRGAKARDGEYRARARKLRSAGNYRLLHRQYTSTIRVVDAPIRRCSQFL
jgi:hypothetical protein